MKKKIGVVGAVLLAGMLGIPMAQDRSDVKTTQPPINDVIQDLAKDGTFSKTDAESVALEVTRRLWWPDSSKTAVISSAEKDGTWTVSVQDRRGTEADPGGHIIVSHRWLVSATFFPGE